MHPANQPDADNWRNALSTIPKVDWGPFLHVSTCPTDVSDSFARVAPEHSHRQPFNALSAYRGLHANCLSNLSA